MITDNTKWHYLASKSVPTNDGFMKPTQSISRLFSKITSTNTATDYYCLNCLHSYRTESSLRKHDHCEILMPGEESKILKYLQGSKSLKIVHTISVHTECLLVKHDTCANNLNKSYTKTISTHVPCGYSISVNNEFKANYHIYYRGKDCMEKLSKEILRIGKEIASEEKHITTLTDNEKPKHKECKKCHICNKHFNTNKKSKNQNLKKLEIIVITQENIEVLHSLYVT